MGTTTAVVEAPGSDAVAVETDAADAAGADVSGADSGVGDEPAAEPASVPVQWADESRPPTALTWVDPAAVAAASAAPAFETAVAPDAGEDLLADARLLPGWLRPRLLVPVGILVALCGSYTGATLLSPLDAVAPTVEAVQLEVAAAPAAQLSWPQTGSAAVGIEGMSSVASTTGADGIASITKVVSTLMVLDKLPLKPGEQGPSFEFGMNDAREFWSYRRGNQSSLDVPVGGSLTEYQMLQGILLGSANNYIDRLSDEIWGSDRAFAEASEKWLADHGIEGVRLVSPSGFDERNVATPEALVEIGELAMRHPVFAEIVGTRTAEIPGVGTVTNTNRMLEDPGVVGIKTGTLEHWNILTAKDVVVDDTTVRVVVAVLGQDSNGDRLAVTRQLLAETEKALAEQPTTVEKGTVVGRVTTEWGEEAEIVTDADAEVVLWNGAAATTGAEFDLDGETEAGAEVGTLTAKGPVDTAQTSVSLDEQIDPPSIWWRLTHPLELFGLD